MGNMGYCMFQNTEQDLRACRDALGDGIGNLSDDERAALYRMVLICREILDDAADDVMGVRVIPRDDGVTPDDVIQVGGVDYVVVTRGA